jgi:hypothetical protein
VDGSRGLTHTLAVDNIMKDVLHEGIIALAIVRFRLI